MKISVLVADKFPDLYVQQMKDLGLEVIYSPKLGENDLPEAAKNVDILVVRSTVVNAETVQKSEKLNLIIRAGAGVNNINISAANQKGIYVANCPGMNSIAVAELAVGLMVALDRRIPDNVNDFKNGNGIKESTPNPKVYTARHSELSASGTLAKKLQNALRHSE